MSPVAPLKSMVVALMLLVLLHMPQLLTASSSKHFRFQRFSAASELLRFRPRSSTKVVEQVSSPVAHDQSGSPIAGNQSSAPAPSAAAANSRSAKGLRGVRKLLFGTLSCAPKDLSLTQGPVSSNSGIPTFNVQIVNLCGTCAMADIHVACGNWASATPVDPFVFTRLGYNDCLVNNGRPLSSQGSLSFQYSNSAMYPMSIATATSECTR